MCGIVGLLDTTLAPAAARRVVVDSLAMIEHRGEPGHRGELWADDRTCAGANRLAFTSGQEPQP